MTSKEKLQRSINALNYKKSQNGKLSNVDEARLKCYEEVVKDLELLEILKNESDNKRINERDGIATFHLDMVLTIDNYPKIKNWLEGE